MAKRIALFLSLILGVYLFFAASRGIDLIAVDDPAVRTLGISVIVLAVIGAIVIFREIRFGKLSYVMGQTIDESYLPIKEALPESKKEYLDLAIEKAKTDSNNWQAWYAVALGYDLISERRLARESMQHAVALYQAAKPK